MYSWVPAQSWVLPWSSGAPGEGSGRNKVTGIKLGRWHDLIVSDTSDSGVVLGRGYAFTTFGGMNCQPMNRRRNRLSLFFHRENQKLGKGKFYGTSLITFFFLHWNFLVSIVLFPSTKHLYCLWWKTERKKRKMSLIQLPSNNHLWHFRNFFIYGFLSACVYISVCTTGYPFSEN